MADRHDEDRSPYPVGVVLSEDAIRHVSGGEQQVVRRGSTFCETNSNAGPDLEQD